MDERDRTLLERMVLHAEAAIAYKRKGGRSWWRDEQTIDAILTRITQVGEAAAKVTAATAASIPGIPWVQIRNTRHRVVHDYMNTDLVIVREVVNRELPVTVRLLAKALRPDGPPRARPTTRPRPATKQRTGRASDRVRGVDSGPPDRRG